MYLTTRSFGRVLAPLALMAVIFALSAQSNLGTDLGVIDLIGRKIGHAGVYALLTFLWWWALGGLEADSTGTGSRIALAVAAAIAFVYAVSDEFHQTFVDGRVGSPIDVAIDTVGIAVAWLLIARGHAQRLIAAIRHRISR